MCQEQRCPKCSSDAMLYCEKNAVWICGKCRSLFSSRLDEIACDEASLHKLLLWLACEDEGLFYELIRTLPDPQILIPMETEKSAGENQRELEERDAMANAYQEMWLILQNTDREYRDMVPAGVMELLDRKRNREYHSKLDPTKELKDNTLLRETDGLLSYFYMEYWSDPEGKKKFERILDDNQDKTETMTRMELYRRLDAAEPADGDLDLEAESASASFGKACAELCRIMDYLPKDVAQGIFSPEALIAILRHRDYDHYCLMKGRLFSFANKTAMAYNGTSDTLRILAGLIRGNLEDYNKFDDRRREAKRLIAEGERIRGAYPGRAWTTAAYEKYGKAFDILRSYARDSRWIEDHDLLVRLCDEYLAALDIGCRELQHDEYNAAMYGVSFPRPNGGWDFRKYIDAMKKGYRRELAIFNSLVRKGISPEVNIKHLKKVLSQAEGNQRDYPEKDEEMEKQIKAAEELLGMMKERKSENS